MNQLIPRAVSLRLACPRHHRQRACRYEFSRILRGGDSQPAYTACVRARRGRQISADEIERICL